MESETADKWDTSVTDEREDSTPMWLSYGCGSHRLYEYDGRKWYLWGSKDTVNDHPVAQGTLTFSFNNQYTYPCKRNHVKVFPVTVDGCTYHLPFVQAKITHPPEQATNEVPHSVDDAYSIT